MSLNQKQSRNFITNELAASIRTACAIKSQEKANGLSRRRLFLTYNFRIDEINQAKAYFQESGNDILWMKYVKSAITGDDINVYYVSHNNDYFTVVVEDGIVTQCV
jgi:hypothetical protein